MDLFGERLIGWLVFINEHGSTAYLSVAGLKFDQRFSIFDSTSPKTAQKDNKTMERFTRNAQQIPKEGRCKPVQKLGDL